MSKAQKELEDSVNELSLSPQTRKKASALKKKAQPVIDSWEDGDFSSGEETGQSITAQGSIDYLNAPPPTPSSPTATHKDNSYPIEESWGPAASYGGSVTPRGSERTTASIRPEKTDAVAKRLVAGALGVRAPKKTDEQRVYEKALKEKEMKRRNAEKEAKVKAEEEAARARAAAWSD